MRPSSAWRDFLEHLREITELLRVDPASSYAQRKTGHRVTNVDLSSALTKAAMLLTSGRLQGCIVSQVQEFLERIDHSGMPVDQIPDVLRAHLALRYPKSEPHEQNVLHAIAVQQANAPLWTAGVNVQPGMIKTSSLPDSVWNPWPNKVQELLGRCDIDLFSYINQQHGSTYLMDLKTNVKELVEFRNKVAHGDEPQPVGTPEVRRSMRWAIRLARASDIAFAEKLTELTGKPAW
jgi:hypothetical protein